MKSIICLIILLMSTAVAVAEEISSSQVRKYAKQLKALIHSESKASLGEFIKEIGEIDHPKVVILLPPAATQVPSRKNYRAACKLIAKLENDASIDALIKILRKKRRVDFREQNLILNAFGRRRDDKTLAAILKSLASPIGHVQTSAVRALRRRKQAEPIPVLIDLLDKQWEQRDRTFFEVYVALAELTGQTFDSAEDWRNFWETVKANFDPRKVGKKKGAKTVVRPKPSPTDRNVAFFNSEIFSRSVVFVIDVSGSMAMYDGEDENYSRLTRAQEQLVAALKKMPRGALFNVVAFSHTVKAWQDRMQPVTKAAITKAIKYVNSFKPLETTHTDEAMKRAFKDPRVDTVVLLSDGAPVKSKVRDTKRLMNKIIKWIQDANSSRQVRVDTFGFEGQGQWPSRYSGLSPPPPTRDQVRLFIKFLKKLSKDTGGRYQRINT